MYWFPNSVKKNCNNTLPRGVVYWKIRPLRQSRGPRRANFRGGVFSNSSRLEAVYCHFFFQSRSVMEITLHTAGVYWQYIDSIHSRSMKNDNYYVLAGWLDYECQIVRWLPQVMASQSQIISTGDGKCSPSCKWNHWAGCSAVGLHCHGWLSLIHHHLDHLSICPTMVYRFLMSLCLKVSCTTFWSVLPVLLFSKAWNQP